ncbi:DNA topoisomerase-like protein [Dorcoceras hygrometricum]|uniref:DNA topoisomerase-like protein n=1 Tax=Dorcoceras hygrometricum TaxID=472368 RepID=A0A2Z7C040_9LAMI|nr:DNA topoisomerase-like protein [Dorcoceras hygrometricum]
MSSFSRKLQWNRISRELQPAVGIWRLAIAKRCRVNKLERQCFAFAYGSVRDVIIFSRWFERAVARISRRKQQQHPVVSFYESAVATHSVVGKSSRELQYPVAGNSDARKEKVAKRCIQSKNESAAKQLATYEETQFKREEVAANGINSNRGLYTSRAPLKNKEELREAFEILPVQARRRKTLVYVVSHTVAAVVHLRSLGVLTAAGCGIGSVHAVVRSNLLVEPSEEEEGEM